MMEFSQIYHSEICKKNLFWPFVLFSIASIASIFFTTPDTDTIYYWDWSRHLAFGYYDGPPMVAYLIHEYTHLFGNSELAFNILASLSNFSIAALIYLLGYQLFDQQVAFWSMAIWLFSPIIFLKYQQSFVYDAPVTLFWLAVLICFYWAHKSKKNQYWYMGGFFGGCMMLSKYTGILLFIALFIMMICNKPYRYLFKNIHVYLAGMLAFLFFLPALLWNYEHGFSSFFYQWQHGFDNTFSLWNLVSYILGTAAIYNIIFFFFVFFVILHYKVILTDERFAILFYPAAVTLIFFAIAAPFNASYHATWNETFFMTTAVLVAYFALKSSLSKKILFVSLIFYSVMSLLMLSYFLSQSQSLAWKQNALEVNQVYDGKELVFSDNYTTAAVLAYYLHGQPQIYSFPLLSNQYQYWSTATLEKIQTGDIHQILFVSTSPNRITSMPYLLRCHLLLATHHGRKPFFVARCFR